MSEAEVYNFSRETNVAPADQYRGRVDLLQWLVERFGYERYLEIGCFNNSTFQHFMTMPVAVGVDPERGGTKRMTSDAYFAQRPPGETFQLVFIDGLHEAQQVLRDTANALKALEPGGTIVYHDCLPFNEQLQRYPRPEPHTWWNGNVWKAWYALHQCTEFELHTVNMDWGMGVLRLKADGDVERATQFLQHDALSFLDADWNKDYAHIRQWVFKPVSFSTFADRYHEYKVSVVE